MKKLKKTMLAAMVLLYVGITVTVTLPKVPDVPENPGIETYGTNGKPNDPDPFGPFDEGDGNKH